MIEHAVEWFGSRLFSLALPDLVSLPPALEQPSSYFVCVLVWDARREDRADVLRLANALLEQGLVYLCAWGPDCERVHDLFDFAIVMRTIRDERDYPLVMTTWHNDETLDDTLWFALNAANPDPAYEEDCGTRLALSIGNDDWAAQIRRRFDDPEGFDQEMLEAFGRGDV